MTARFSAFGHRAAVLLSLGGLLLAACRDDVTTAPSRHARGAALADGYARLVVGIESRDAQLMVVELSAPDLKEPLVYKFEGDPEGRAEIHGTVAVPAGEERRIVVRGYDAEGRERWSGESMLVVEKELTPQVRFALLDSEDKEGAGVEAYAGSYRMALDPKFDAIGEDGSLRLTGFMEDPDGQPVPVEPGDILPPREVGEIEIVYTERDFFEINGRLFIEKGELDLSGIVLCSQQVKACGRVPRPPFPPITFPIDSIIEVAGGHGHTCALRRSGLAKCWGDNARSQLGVDAAGTDHLAQHVFTDISAGFEHTCAIDASGAAWCWGANGHWQTGVAYSGAGPNPVPNPVQGGHAFTRIAAGGYHTCAIDTAGEAWCWGWRTAGQTGDGSMMLNLWNATAPVKVAGGHLFTEISAGYLHTCGLTTGGRILCWGDNQDGQTASVWGTGTTASNKKCDINANGTLTHCSRTPDGSYATGYVAVSSGGDRSCGLTYAGEIYCWGDAFVGDGSLNDDWVHSLVSGGHVFTDVSVGASHSCGIADGKAWCWGENFDGQLGDGIPTTHKATPVLATSPASSPTATHAFVEAGLGSFHSCAITTTRTELFCWGRDATLQLGTSTIGNRHVPTLVTVF